VDSFSGRYAASAHEQSVGVNAALAAAATDTLRFKLLNFDDQGKPDVAEKVASAALAQDAEILIGTQAASVALSVAAVAARGSIPFIASGTATTSLLNPSRFPTTFLLNANLSMRIDAIVRYLSRVNVRSVLFIDDTDSAASEAPRLFAQLLRKRGISTATSLIENVDVDVLKMSRKLDDLTASHPGPQAVVIDASVEAITHLSATLPALHRNVRLVFPMVRSTFFPSLPSGAISASAWDPALALTPLSPALAQLRRGLGAPIKEYTYLGFIAALQAIQRLSRVGVRDQLKLVADFLEHPMIADGKRDSSRWRRVDHQAAQDVFAVSILENGQTRVEETMPPDLTEMPRFCPDCDHTCSQFDATPCPEPT
jgi:ABC-type branched-subunit amino acid transport system substrate-binding protein